MNKDNQHDLVVGQCRHCHKTYQKLRYSYYILAMLCSLKCTINYYGKYYYKSLKYYIVNTGLFTPPFDTTNIEWRTANKPVIVQPITKKEITGHLVTIIPSIYKILKAEVLTFSNFLLPIIKHQSYLCWRGLNYSAMLFFSAFTLALIFSLSLFIATTKSTTWITSKVVQLSLALAYILTMLAVQLVRIIAIVPAFLFSVITIGFNSLVEPVGNFIKTFNHRYPRMPLYESLCLLVVFVYGSHTYTMFSANANLPDFNISVLLSTSEKDVEPEVETSTPKSIDKTRESLISRLKSQQTEIALKRKELAKKKNIIKKISKAEKPKERVMVASINKTIPIIKKRPSIKKIIPADKTKVDINPLYVIPDFKRGSTRSMNMTFTFDGGSSDNEVDTILPILRERNIRTTFFLTGNFIKEYPNRVKQILKDGHEIANHTLSHPHLTSFEKNREHNTIVTKKMFLKELKATEENYFKVTGKKLAPFWRAPYGEVNSEIISWAFEAGYIHVGWTTNRATKQSLDTLDWVADKKSSIYYSASGIKNKILSFNRGGTKLKGGIVLMHLGTNRKTDKASSKLGSLIDNTIKRGYKAVKISTLYIGHLQEKNKVMPPLSPQMSALLAPYIKSYKLTVAQRDKQKDLNSKADAIRKAHTRRSESK